ncbi:hypothetical protein KP509_21G048000 [Ceratopteris richardii]|uniref:SOUL heme-binding protein n=1 Tax=Ceratopteris richardii TaxID=49495 RepID=A0A8T2S9P4_CERRI|nr:hypothetical protein KP509_21G048000 [Ceratopteris richardii]
MALALRSRLSWNHLQCRGSVEIWSSNSNRDGNNGVFPLTVAPFTSNSRVSLLLALSNQVALQVQKNVQSFASEAIKYVNPRRGEARSLEEALMSVPDLETISYRVLKREKNYESYVVAETLMPGYKGFDFYGASEGFNTLAAYLFGKNLKREEMEMTTPVLVSRIQSEGEKMEMTTPVISQQDDTGRWKMAFVMPSKYGESLPLPIDDSITIRRVPSKMTAVSVFSGFVTDDIALIKEQELRKLIESDTMLQVKDSAEAEVSQYNPPFTPPFMRRNEISLEVVPIDSS